MNLRRIAANVLAQVISQGQSLNTALEDALKSIENPKDKAFVQAICYGVIRHYFSLENLCHQLLSKPLKAKDFDVQALLLVGLYQLKYSRVKPHAAVAETVAAIKHKPWAKSLVNAILRTYLRQQESLEKAALATCPQLDEHPDWLSSKIKTDWPDEAEAILAQNNLQPPMHLRINPLRTSTDDYLNQLETQEIVFQRSPYLSTAICLEKPLSIDEIPDFQSGYVSIQDLAAQLSVSVLDAQPNHSVLDVCAAPGGKTCAILESVPTLQKLVAIDIDAQRLTRIHDNLKRLGLDAEVKQADATQIDTIFDEYFDRILVDAPCSGLGVIRRHPDIKLLRRESDIPNLVNIQAQILKSAWQRLKPGGILVYATCSILKDENEYQIEHFLSEQKDAVHIPLSVKWGSPRPFGQQIFTGQDQMDGFYYAKLQKL